MWLLLRKLDFLAQAKRNQMVEFIEFIFLTTSWGIYISGLLILEYIFYQWNTSIIFWLVLLFYSPSNASTKQMEIAQSLIKHTTLLLKIFICFCCIYKMIRLFNEACKTPHKLISDTFSTTCSNFSLTSVRQHVPSFSSFPNSPYI